MATKYIGTEPYVPSPIPGPGGQPVYQPLMFGSGTTGMPVGGLAQSPTYDISQYPTVMGQAQHYTNLLKNAYNTQQGAVGQATGARRSPIVQNLLSGAAREATNMAANPLGRTVISTPKSPEAQSRIAGQYQQYDQNQTTKKQSITDFVNELIANKPKNRMARDQEAAAVDRVYSTGPGSLQAELAANRRAAQLAQRSATQQAIGRASRDRNVAQMAGGNSSYLNRAYGDTLARIMAEAAARDAATGRDDILYTQGQRTGLLGTRGRLNDEFAARELAPIDAMNRYQSGELGLLSSIAGLEDQNTIYDSFTPEQSIARQLALIEQIQQLEAMGIDPSQFVGSGSSSELRPRTVNGRAGIMQRLFS